MSEALYPYYERELLFIRQLAQEFAKRYPAAAGRLLLEPNRSSDPHVERLIESFALLAGRVHHKLDDEFPELTDAMLGVLYPHYLAPVPSMAIIQFDLDPGRSDLLSGDALAGGAGVGEDSAAAFSTALEAAAQKRRRPPFAAQLPGRHAIPRLDIGQAPVLPVRRESSHRESL